jgi:thiamine pyrophosphate-dependent acetolactate synthase large subunit-like protein
MGAAIGAKLGRRDHLVVHLLGDASFGMTGMEIETAVRMGLPTLTVLITQKRHLVRTKQAIRPLYGLLPASP